MLFNCLFLIFPIIFQVQANSNNNYYNIIENLSLELLYPSAHDTKRSSKCEKQISLIAEQDPDTLSKMIDASTKIIPSGVLNGNYFDLGNFNECYEIHSNITQETIFGKYCLGTLSLPHGTASFETRRINNFLHPEPRILANSLVGIHSAVCIPSGCTAEDMSTDLNPLWEEWCYSKETEPELDTGAWVTIGVLIFFLSLMIISTIFDLYCHYSGKKTPHDICIAFSAFTNGRKLFKSTKNADQLLCLNGIKAISMMWVVLGHDFSSAISAPLQNFLDVTNFMSDSANMYMMSATLSVDTFFVVGGLVTVYAFLKSMDKGVKFNIIMFYVHRYLRLTPALLIMALIHMFLLKFLGNGPLWNTVDITLGAGCRKAWWTSFTYLGNYFLDDGVCVGQSWYLNVDMQLFVLSPLILIPLAKWPKKVMIGLGFLIIVSMVIPFAIGYSYELPAFISSTQGQLAFSRKYYVQPWTRFGPYVMGMALGYLVYNFKKSAKKLSLRLWQVCGLWLIALGILVGILYAPYDLMVNEDKYFDDYKLSAAFFLGYHRHVWSAGLCLVILLCVFGFGGPINAFLSLPIFQLLTKLSYSIYLVHYCFLNIKYSSLKTTIEFTTFNVMRDFWGDFVYSAVLGMVLCLTFESPIITLEKIIFGGGTPKKDLPK